MCIYMYNTKIDVNIECVYTHMQIQIWICRAVYAHRKWYSYDISLMIYDISYMIYEYFPFMPIVSACANVFPSFQ